MALVLHRHIVAVLQDRPAPAGTRPLAAPLLAVVWGGLAYGAVMGSFGGLGGERFVQVLYSAAKVPLLLLVTTGLALPSFFVINSLLGLRSDFAPALRAVVGTQGAVAVILAALAPYTAIWYATSGGYHEAITFNGAMFAVASVAAQWVLRRRYAPLITRDPRHRVMLRVWLVVYCFVGIQMGWILRPFIGYPSMPPSFFREDTWGNAYVIVADTVWRAFTR